MARRTALLLLALALLGACGSTGAPTTSVAPTQAALAPTVSVDEAAQLRDGGAFVLDVREPAEWTQGHIPGATLIPLGELASRVGELPRDMRIVVVCRSGNRSAEGRDILLGAGFPAVTSLDGGLTAWARAGLPVEGGG